MSEKISDIINQLTNTPELKEFDDTMKKYKLGGYKKKISKLNLDLTNVPTTLPELTRNKIVDYINMSINGTNFGKKIGITDSIIDELKKTITVDELKKHISEISKYYIKAMTDADNGTTEEIEDLYDDITQRLLNLGKQVPKVYIEATFKNNKINFFAICDLLERAERYKEQGADDMVDYCLERIDDIITASIT